MTSPYENFLSLIEDGTLDVVERVELPGRPERRAAIPKNYLNGPLRQWLTALFPEGKIWSHQTLALNEIAAGANVVVATGTASGKSLIFQIPLLQTVLESGGKALVLYPLKALLGDQLARWRTLVQNLGLPPSTVAELSGDIELHERAHSLSNAQIVVATPDVVQAWVMRNLRLPEVRAFLGDLRYLVLDEAHSYESVFGSNTAFLFRRVFAARSRLRSTSARKFQIIAATATILNPAEHLRRLTGRPFLAVLEAHDGSPRQPRTLLHLAAPADSNESVVGALVDRVTKGVSDGNSGTLIAFLDSRQGVERVSSAFESEDIVPYRGGYESRDRKEIERRMRDGKLRAVIATSALELGIDVPGITVGINAGVPASKKAYRQRLGRVGRASPGIFAVVADNAAFTKLGSSFREYYEGSVEPSYLYLDNRFIAFAHAKCLLDEAEQTGAKQGQPPADVDWPDSFDSVFKIAIPGSARPSSFDVVNQLATTATSPQLAFPLRQIGEANFILQAGSRGATEKIGDITHNQAIREAYPGALYRHYKRPLKVREWRSGAFERYIRLENALDKRSTRPTLHTTINVSLDSDSVVDGRVRSSAKGLLAEVSMRVSEAVIGFRIGTTSLLYRDLRANDPGMATRSRDFDTTGVIVRINEPWFSGGAGRAAHLRAAFADGLYEMLVREKSIAPYDLDRASTRIALIQSGSPHKVTDAIVIYDAVYGGLRLTEPLFSEFDTFMDRLSRAAERAGEEAFIDAGTADAIRNWYENLEEGMVIAPSAAIPREGEIIVYAPGSRVCVRRNGMLIERTLLEPTYQNVFGEETLVYRTEEPAGGPRYVMPDAIEPSGQEWRKVYWNPRTGRYTELDADDGAF